MAKVGSTLIDIEVDESVAASNQESKQKAAKSKSEKKKIVPAATSAPKPVQAVTLPAFTEVPQEIPQSQGVSKASHNSEKVL
jgi:hypothetical protein